MIRHWLKKNFYGRYLISCLHCIESYVYPRIINDEKAVKKYYKKQTGKELNLQHPCSFAEKLNWYKLNARLPLMQQCADKVAVRDYVISCGYEDALNELYAVYDSVTDIDLSELPDSFVLKAAHGSHMNIVVRDKRDINWWQARLMMSSWLHQDIYWSGREWVYKDMPRRILAEKYLEDETGELRDFKFFCFNGEPQFLQYDVGRFSDEHIRNYYDMDMKLLEITDTSTVSRDVGNPIARLIFEEMKDMARKLAAPFQFVRADFYVVHDKIYFGELTYFDGGGYSGFSKEEYDVLFGSKWRIEN